MIEGVEAQGYGEMVKIARIEPALLRLGDLIEGTDIPTGMGMIRTLISSDRIEDGRILNVVWVEAC